MKPIRDFLSNNDPYLRLIEVIVLVFGGVYITLQQTKLSERSLEVSQNELAVAEQELKLVALQTEIARFEQSPHFIFEKRYDKRVWNMTEQNVLVAKNVGGHVRYLDGHVDLYVEATSKSGKTKRVRIDNLFEDHHPQLGPVDDDSFEFWYFTDRVAPGQLGYAINAKYEDGNPFIRKDVPWQAYCFTELTYVRLDGQQVTELYRTAFCNREVLAMKERPKYDIAIDFRKFLIREDLPDYEGLEAELKKAFDKLLAD